MPTIMPMTTFWTMTERIKKVCGSICNTINAKTPKVASLSSARHSVKLKRAVGYGLIPAPEASSLMLLGNILSKN